MTDVLVLYYSSYGHTQKLAEAVAQGVRQVPGARAVVKRVPDLPSGARRDGAGGAPVHPEATVAELPEYDGIIVGAPTRFGRMAGAMADFLDQAGGLWMQHKLVGKVGSAFTSVGTQHGGHETTLLSTINSLLHFGMVIVGVPYTELLLLQTDELSGGGPMGATTLAGGMGQRSPTPNELAIATTQGRTVARTAAALRHAAS